METLIIEVLDTTGNWRQAGMTINNSAVYILRMQEIQKQFNGARVRVVTTTGALVDILM
ncbi:MAG: hypothetical protein K2P80_00315 [Beijerinckiaceae bacterium]|nr:hypothetical protein [Beijerinckiaceae bacterium]